MKFLANISYYYLFCLLVFHSLILLFSLSLDSLILSEVLFPLTDTGINREAYAENIDVQF